MDTRGAERGARKRRGGPRSCAWARTVRILDDCLALAVRADGGREQGALGAGRASSSRLSHLILEQDAAAKKMKVHRSTVSRILTAARKKIADALVYHHGIKIEGGCCKVKLEKIKKRR